MRGYTMNSGQLIENREQVAMSNTLRLWTKTVFCVLCSVVSALCFLFFLSCETPFAQANRPQIPAGMGSFSLSIAERTVMPDLPELADCAVFEMSFYEGNFVSGAEPAAQIFLTYHELQDPVFLMPGTYTLIVTAYTEFNDSVQKTAASGTLSGITIKYGVHTSQSVPLRAVSRGTGTFTWNITFDIDGDLETADMHITHFGSGETAAELNISNLDYMDGKVSSGSVVLESGYYRVYFSLAKAGAEKISWREILHVYQNLESVLERAFTDSHFDALVHYYTVTFNLNGGTGTVPELQTRPAGAKIAQPSPGPVKAGFTFTGWHTDAAGSNPWNFVTDIVTQNITLYAGWAEEQQVFLTCIFEGIVDGTPSLEYSGELRFSRSQPITFSLNNAHEYSSITWWHNEELQNAADSMSSVTFPEQYFPPGIKFITIDVVKDGIPYSLVVEFEVVL